MMPTSMNNNPLWVLKTPNIHFLVEEIINFQKIYDLPFSTLGRNQAENNPTYRDVLILQGL